MTLCTDMKLFKYVTEEHIAILEDGLIRFTQPQAFNDPFELKPQISSIASPLRFEEHLNTNFQAILREEYEKLPHHVKMALPFSAFVQFAESKREELLGGIKELAKQATPLLEKMLHEGFERHIGIFSVTESPNNLLMWAHYANSHQGFVIEFDSTHHFFDQRKSEEDELRHLSKVIYSENRPNLQLAQINSINEFLVKSNVWAYEEEWRILFALSDAENKIENNPYDIHLFKVPFDAIRAVLIGARATPETRKHIESVISSNTKLAHVKLFEMKIHEERFELKMEEKPLGK